MLSTPLVLVLAMLFPRASTAYMVGGSRRCLLQSSPRAGTGLQHVRMMALKTGIVGLPNVGKSTLFNALMEESQAQAANFPFCTIEPNVGVVAVPDPKLAVLGDINTSEKLVPTSLSFVDIAGLVEGASKGEGLGNQFLANIRECDAIVHTVRCFVDDNIVHVSGSVDPLRDIEVINLELVLADLAQVDRRKMKVDKERGNANPDEKSALEKLSEALDAGTAARQVELTKEELESVKGLGLLSAKPIIYAANVADTDLADGNEMVEKVRALAETEGASVVIVSAQVEAELVELDDEERVDFLESLGVQKGEVGLERLIQEVYSLLKLRTYYTSGPTETKAWTIRAGMLAPQAAGVIHSDFERGFIRAETVAYNDLVSAGDMKKAKEAGTVRAEGKEYEVQEGDVLLFRFNV
jgi:GTP-binding protein YchF